ncbi:MAG: TIGR03560 family F420-dependent LLM class oxidoreductase [Candidatus Kariarchaeaceae archaeon]
MKTKFAIQIEPQLGFDYETIKNITLEAEKLDYHALWVSDHFFLDDKSEEKNCLEAWTLLGALAAVTSKIRLGTLVSSQSYRYPAVLAKIASTVDMISDGRLEFGIGAGWKEMEYKAYGIPFPSVKDRMDQLDEYIQIIKLLWTKAKPSFTGKHYHINEAFSAPKPVQKLPPIFIGGSGKKRIMKFVAQYGDYINLPFTPIDEIPAILDALKGHCKTHNRDFESIGKSYFTQVFVAETEEEVEQYIKERASYLNISIEDLKQRINGSPGPGAWVGTPEKLLERIRHLIDMGFDYFNLMFPYPNDLELTRSFEKLVMRKI